MAFQLSQLISSLGFGKQQPSRRARAAGAIHRRKARLGFESLERREMMATTPVVFSIPPDVASRGVEVAIYGTLSLPTSQQDPNPTYTNNQNLVIANGSLIFYNSAIGDYDVPGPTSDLTFDLAVSANQATVNLEQTGIASGVIVIGVGGSLDVEFLNGTISVPTPSTETDGYYGLFEFSIGANLAYTDFSWNIDLSLIDQIGFPFTVSANTSTPQLGANTGVGIQQYRGDLFNLYPEYIAQMATYNGDAAAFQQNFLYGDGYRILATQNLITGNPAPIQKSLQTGTSGKFAPNTTYYYWVTATSATGESTYDGHTKMVLGQSTKATVKASATLAWNPLDGATGYKVYRGTSNNPGQAQLIYTANSASTLTYTDKGAAGTAGTPPTNSYTFNPLNYYFNDSLDDFFSYYESNQFSITATFYDTNGSPPEPVYSTFTGYTDTSYQINGTGPTYTVLKLTSADPNFAGEEYLIFKPYFSDNTNIPGAPSAPSWMQNTAYSPGWMVFACDGVFASGSLQPGLNGLQQTALNGIQNSIVSAFNRGLATNFTVAPSAWINYPDMRSATATVGSGLNPDTYYYYVVTAVSNGLESPASVMYAAQTTSSNSQITLDWKPQDVYDAITTPLGVDSYNVYRSTTPGIAGSSFTKIANVPNSMVTPATSYTDASLTTIGGSPVMYYEPGSISNWYAAFTHLNYTTNPISGVSIDGHGYGFPYDDQGNFSSDFTADNPTQININLLPWTTRSSVPTNPTLNPLPAPPTSPVGVTILAQPANVQAGVQNSVKFKAYTSFGHTYFGGALVTVTLINSKGQPTPLGTVTTDEITGEATFNFKVNTAGKYMLKFTLANGHEIFSSIFQITPSSMLAKKGKLLKK